MRSLVLVLVLVCCGCATQAVRRAPRAIDADAIELDAGDADGDVWLDLSDAVAPNDSVAPSSDAEAVAPPDAGSWPADSGAPPSVDSGSETADSGSPGAPDATTEDAGPTECAPDPHEPNDALNPKRIGATLSKRFLVLIDAALGTADDVDAYWQTVTWPAAGDFERLTVRAAPGALVTLSFQCNATLFRCGGVDGPYGAWDACVAEGVGSALLDIRCDDADGGELSVVVRDPSGGSCEYEMMLQGFQIDRLGGEFVP